MNDIENIDTIIAAACAGIAIMCLVIAFMDIIQNIDVQDVDKDEYIMKLPSTFKLMLHFTGNIKWLINSGLFGNSIKKSGETLLMAGYDEETITGSDFVGIRIMCAITGIFFLALFFVVERQITGLIIFMLLVLQPILWLKMSKAKRHLEIQKALPNVLDLLTLSVEAGKDFLAALKDILGKRKRDALSEELGRTFNEIQIGKKRAFALKDLSMRVQQPELTSVLNSIIQADELGVSIGQILRIQGDQLRSKRFQRAEKLANEAPVKILFPIVVFIFPAVLLLLMGPILLQAANTM